MICNEGMEGKADRGDAEGLCLVSPYHLEPCVAFSTMAVVFCYYGRMPGTCGNFFRKKRGLCDRTSHDLSLSSVWPPLWGTFDCVDVWLGSGTTFRALKYIIYHIGLLFFLVLLYAKKGLEKIDLLKTNEVEFGYFV